MANYILVHGGDCAGEILDEVAVYLEHHGHNVYAPSMVSVTEAT